MDANDWLWLVGAYGCGSVPFGFLAGLLRGVDLRKAGSGNIGATNAWRVLGKGWGLAVFALDFLKGLGPVVAARWAGAEEGVLLGAALGAIVGHNFPVWLGFRGGKGIATSAGAIAGLFPWVVFVSSLGAWVAGFVVTRIVSVGSIAAALMVSVSTAVLWGLGMASGLLLGVACVMTMMAVWRHRANIRRLMEGTEPRFGQRKAGEGAGKEADAGGCRGGGQG